MKPLATTIRLLDRLTEGIGRAAAWLSLAMVLVTCWIVLTRYAFNEGSVAVQESVIYLNGLLFMLCAAYTLKHDGHVRVDIFYGRASARYRAWTNLLGSLFLLLPVSGFILWACWDYVASSWAIREQSGEAGGLAWVWLLKSLILVMAATLLLQGLAEILRNALRLWGSAAPAPDGGEEEAAL